MDIDVPLRELGAFDTTSLGEPVLDQEDVFGHARNHQKYYPMADRTSSKSGRLTRLTTRNGTAS